jgi:hypothetical protein
MSEGMIRVVGGRAAFQGPNEDRYVSSTKLLAYLHGRIASAESIVTEGRCSDFPVYKQNVGALMELRAAVRAVEKLLKGKEDHE